MLRRRKRTEEEEEEVVEEGGDEDERVEAEKGAMRMRGKMDNREQPRFGQRSGGRVSVSSMATPTWSRFWPITGRQIFGLASLNIADSGSGCFGTLVDRVQT